MADRPRLSIALLSFATVSEETLRERAAPVLPTGFSAKERAHEGRRKAFFAGRSCISALLQSEGLTDTVVPDPQFGFVTLKNHRELSINISHTDEVAVAALSTSPLGVDIERADRPISQKVLDKILLPGEEEGLRRVLGEAFRPVFLWSVKEAISKATGLGIKFGLSAFEIIPANNPPWPVKLGETGPLTLVDPAITILRWNEFVISLCAQKQSLFTPPTLRIL